MDEIRAKRASALEEKRKKLEELKARRGTRSTATSVAVSTNKSATLDDYIDDLLNNAPPAGVVVLPTTPARQDFAPKADDLPKRIQEIPVLDIIPTSSRPELEDKPWTTPKMVETFTIAVQTDDFDFPDEMERKVETITPVKENVDEDRKHFEEVVEAKFKEPTLLSEDQFDETVSSETFTQFFNTASKKVERLLGAPILSDLLVSDTTYYTDKESKREVLSIKGGKDSFVSAKVSFSFPKWTQNRNVTSLDWSPHHRGELMLASYHIPFTSKSTMGETAISTMKPHDTFSSSLLPRSKTEMAQADGLTIIWNLTMPTRPEHIFTCGSPVLNSKFHPSEGSLVVGACYSGQIVVWDVRNGRLPIQKSTLNTVGRDGIGAHVHPVVGMELLDSGFVTASSDGTVNFWSPSNLMEPVEKVVLPDVNISSLAVAPESQTVLVGCESGSIHALIPSASSGSRTSASKRTVLKFHEAHYGNVTGLSTKRSQKSESNVPMSKGFLRNTDGLFLSCGVDWTTKLWAPAYTDKPLLEFLSHSYDYMSDVQWNPVHPSTFATASTNGQVGLWNLAHSLDEPLTDLHGFSVESSDNGQKGAGINRLKWSLDGKRLAVACSDIIHVLGMSEEVWKPKGGESHKVMNNLRGRGFLEDFDD